MNSLDQVQRLRGGLIGKTIAPADPLTLVDPHTRELIEKRRAGNAHPRGWVMRRALAAADMAGVLVAFAVVQVVFLGDNPTVDKVSPGVEVLVFALALPLWVVLGRLYGLYSGDVERADNAAMDDFFAVFNMLTVGAWMLFALASAFEFANPSFPKLALFWLLSIGFVTTGRTIARSLCRRTDSYVQNAVVVGAGRVGQKVARKLLQHPEYGVNVVGLVDGNPRMREEGLGHLAVLGDLADLPMIVDELGVERVIVAFSEAGHAQTLGVIRNLNESGVQVDVVPRLFDVLGPHMRVHAAEGIPLLGLSPGRLSRSSLLLKSMCDRLLSGLALVLLAPVFCVIAASIRFDSPGPVYFRQVRMGRHGKTFTILKFRTMTADADARKSEVAHLNKHRRGDDRMFKIEDDPRVTRVGRVLRRYSLDELPQLWNVFRGDMSLVGPRPLILDEDQHVGGWARKRLELKPGMTGLWQVLGSDDIPFEEMIGLDYRYVTTWSLSTDLKLILRTLPAVVRGRAG